MAFAVNLEVTNDIAKITLSGELDASTAGEFKAVVEKAAEVTPKRIVLLVSDLQFMASAGLRVLIFSRQKMDTGVDIYVVGPQEPVKDTLMKTGFHHSVIMRDEYDASEIETL
jgi:anti-anti-sigma factor